MIKSDCETVREERINRIIEHEGYMKTSILKGVLAAMIVLVVLSGRALLAVASDGVHVVVTDTAGPFTAADPGTCDPITFFPKAGDPVCIFTFGQLFTAAGGFVGSIFLEDTVAQFPDGRAVSTDFETWTGTVTGHGTGMFTGLEYDAVTQVSGTTTSKFRILAGTGTGDLVGITGKGSFSNATGAGVTTMTLEFPGQH